MKNIINEYILEHKIIAIMRGIQREHVIPAAEALYEGGIRLVEVAFNQKDTALYQMAQESIKALSSCFEGRMYIGAGTVMSEKQVEDAFAAGAKYIISPNTNVKVIKRTNDLGLVSMPGALTPTEIAGAYEAGADFVKLFPAGDMGLGYMKSILAPLNHIPLIATGGIDENNIEDYLRAGAAGFGIGSSIVKLSYINAGRFEELTKLAKTYVGALNMSGKGRAI